MRKNALTVPFPDETTQKSSEDGVNPLFRSHHVTESHIVLCQEIIV